MSGLRFSLDQLTASQRQQVERDLRGVNYTTRTHKLDGAYSKEQREPKYHNHAVVVDGDRFDSKLELKEYNKLMALEACGKIRNLRRQVKFSLFMEHGEHLQIYAADFTWEEPHGSKWVFVVGDAKSTYSKKLPAWPKIMKLMENCHGHKIRVLP